MHSTVSVPVILILRLILVYDNDNNISFLPHWSNDKKIYLFWHLPRIKQKYDDSHTSFKHLENASITDAKPLSEAYHLKGGRGLGRTPTARTTHHVLVGGLELKVLFGAWSFISVLFANHFNLCWISIDFIVQYR